MSIHNNQSGFTVVELLVTVLVAAMFAVMFYATYITIIRVNTDTRRSAQASDLAYANLRRYPTIASTNTGCSSSSTTIRSITDTASTDYPQLGKVTELVTVDFPYGCSDGGGLAKITSTVKYKNNTIIMSHAAYVN